MAILLNRCKLYYAFILRPQYGPESMASNKKEWPRIIPGLECECSEEHELAEMGETLIE